MVQNISIQQNNSYGTIKRIGTTDNGRIIYQLIDGENKEAGKISIAQNQADVFEKSYNDIIETAPKLQEYAIKNSSPEAIKKRKKTSKRIIGLSTLTGFLIPAILIKKGGGFKKFMLSLGGTIAGLAGGFGLSFALNTPKGAKKFAQATQNISKLDVQPYRE